MATTRFRFSFYLDTRRKLESGNYPIKVNLYNNFNKKQLIWKIKNEDGIEVSASQKDWLDIWVNKDKKNSFGDVTGETTVYGNKMTIRTILKIKEDILNDILANDDVQSLKDVKDQFNNYKLPTSFVDDVYLEFEKKIAELEALKKYTTRDSNITTLRNICKHNNHWDYSKKEPVKKSSFRFSDVTKFWLDGFELSRSRAGSSTATIAIDMRNLRAIYNRVKEGDAYLMEKYPFGRQKSKYTIKAGKARNQGLRNKDLAKIFKYSTKNHNRMRARDVFLFSFYGGGMNYKDIITLTWTDVENEYFIRKKTKFTSNEEIHVPLKLIEAQLDIISRYKGKGKYVFNFLPDNASDEEIYSEQKSGMRKLDTYIKQMAAELEITPKLSFQWARHSFATNMLLSEKVSKKSIQQHMGHKHGTTTENYFDTLHKEQSEAINKALDLSNNDYDKK